MNEQNLVSAMSGSNVMWAKSNPFNNSTMTKENSSNENQSIMFQNKSSIDNKDKVIIRPSTKDDISFTPADWVYDVYNFREAPGEYKLGFFGEYFYDKFLKQFAEYQTQMALARGMQPEYAQMCGDFSSGMLFEFFGTISVTGLKSTSALNSEYCYDEEALFGSGAGNLYRRGLWSGEIKITDKISKLTEAEIREMLTTGRGHAYRDHIGKTFEEVKKIAEEQNKTCSTFYDEETAMKAIRESLSQNEWKINKWLNDSNPKNYRLQLTCDHPESMGFGAKCNTLTKIDDISQTTMYIYKDSTQALGYRIDTIYPEKKLPGV